MIGKTLKQLFKTINDYNNMKEVEGQNEDHINDIEMLIYIDDMKFYRGTSYREFINKLKEEYIEPVVYDIENAMFRGRNRLLIGSGINTTKLEFYIID